jgi:hypothetical protein
MTMPATASSTKSPPLRGELLDDLPLDHRLGRRCPEYPGGAASE